MILLDTHALAFLVLKPEKLSKAAARAIAKEETRDGVAIASITLWEMAQLMDSGRLRVMGSVESFLRDLTHRPGLTTLDLTAEIAALTVQFPPDFPRDPGDRIIASTSRAHAIPLVTKDERLRQSPLLRTIW
jgi:PIN domain nuclease of toxin-antitoxin system